MINTTLPSNHPQFAGKKTPHKPSPFKTALVGSLLASTGAGASLFDTRKNALIQDPNTIGIASSRSPFALPQEPQANWDELIGAQPVDSFEIDTEAEKTQTALTKSHMHRKLLAANTDPMQPQRRILKGTRAQSIWNASALTPLNYELFSQYTFPSTSPMEPATLKPYTEAEIKEELLPFLNKITNGNQTKINKALAVFDDPALKTKAPDPKIRAALASAKALGFGSAINAYKSNVFSEVKFNNIPYEGAIGYSVRLSGENQQRAWLNPRYKGEDWRLLIETLVHEALHQKAKINKGNAEELIAAATTMPINVKLLLLDPSLVAQNTELARRTNTGTLYRLLTRGPNGELKLLNSTKPNVLPFKNFAGLFDINKPEDAKPSPGNPLLASLLKIFTGKTVQNPNFDWDTIQLLDQNQKYLSYNELLQAAKLLQLDVNDPKHLNSLDLAKAPAPGPSRTEDLYEDPYYEYEAPYGEDYALEEDELAPAKGPQSAPAPGPAKAPAPAAVAAASATETQPQKSTGLLVKRGL